MPPASRPTNLILAAIAALLLCQQLPAADRYEAWLADGKKVTSNFLAAWPTPGSSSRFENQELLDAKNPVRLIRDRAMAASLQAPYVVLANGDIISGSPVSLEPTLGRITAVPRVKLQLEPPLMPVVGTGLAVRTDRIVRIVGSAEAARAEPPPGTVVLADGRRLVARSLRWRELGLAILTSEGIVEAAYGELADVVFLNVDRTTAVLDDNLWAGASRDRGGLPIARFQMAGGAVITTSRVRREIEQSRRRRLTTTVNYYVQPAWADQPMALPETQIVACGFRRPDEVPLSLLTATTLANERLIGKAQPWLANRSPSGGLFTAGGRESDLGISAHAKSAIAFDLPASARTLQMAVAMDKSVGRGGCVKCQVLAGGEQGEVLWNAGIFTGSYGCIESPALDVAGQTRVVLVADYAHEGRPEGADPLDIRDEVVWLAPTVTVERATDSRGRGVSGLLPGLEDWELVGNDWGRPVLDCRWNLLARTWDTVLTLPRQAQLQLRRKLSVTAACEVLEFFTASPRELNEHDFSLTVNGTEVEATNNTPRDELQKWVKNYGRLPIREESDDPRYSDKLAYWWDLSPWRGQEVTLELTIQGALEQNEFAWRNFSLRSPIANLSAGGSPRKPTVQLTSLTVAGDASRGDRKRPAANVIPIPRYRDRGPIRFLGRQFAGGYGLSKDSSVSFPLKPEYREFVAVAGCCLQVAGPMQVLIDDHVVWERSLVSSLSPAEQIEIPIPPGAKMLTLLTGNDTTYSGYAAWAEAGFVTK